MFCMVLHLLSRAPYVLHGLWAGVKYIDLVPIALLPGHIGAAAHTAGTAAPE